MSGHEESVPASEDEAVAEEINLLLGSDPWLRFDVWTSRLWGSVENAMNFAMASDGGPMSPVVQASFCAAQFAQEVAEMVNPLSASANDARRSDTAPLSVPLEVIMDLIADDGDEG